MRRSSCQRLSDAQVAKIEARRRALNLTREKLLERFDRSLRTAGCVYDNLGAAKMRLDRVFNRRMRRPISESTKVALATALGWTIAQLEEAIRVSSNGLKKKRTKQGKGRPATIPEIARDLNDVASRLQLIARKLRKSAR